MKSRYQDVPAYITKDGSVIRELMHPEQHQSLGAKHQSLAEARINPGDTTLKHLHHKSEELYFITQGQAQMHLGELSFAVTAGDTVCIPPGTAHNITNTGSDELVILCCCAPAYAHDDTQLIHSLT